MNNTSNEAVILSSRRYLLYRNQSIDLLSKSMYWFLYDKHLHYQRIKTLFSHHTLKVCSYMLQSRICFFVFFSVWVSFHEYSRFTGQQGKGETISLYPFYHFHSLHGHLDISWVIAAGSSPLCIAGSWIQTGNLWFPKASR